jgi:hypothetical protein
MTSSQISAILKQKGYAMDEWSDFERFNCVMLDQDVRIFTDKKTIRMRFNSSTGTLEVVEGYTKSRQFYANDETAERELDSAEVNHHIDFQAISGFIQSSKFIGNGVAAYHV